MKRAPDYTVARVCEERCPTCIFGPRSPLSPERRREYERRWRRGDTFQNCHYGTLTGDKGLICRGFYDWCEAVGWWPTILQLGERLGRLFFVPVPEIDRQSEPGWPGNDEPDERHGYDA